jgi:hypothetical protein
MIGLEKQSPIIEDLRKHSSSQIAELRLLLAAGIVGRPDVHRPGFYELDGAESVYYVFRYPSGLKVLLIAVWQRVSTPKAA